MSFFSSSRQQMFLLGNSIMGKEWEINLEEIVVYLGEHRRIKFQMFKCFLVPFQLNHLASRCWSDSPFGATSVAVWVWKECTGDCYGKQMTKTSWFGTYRFWITLFIVFPMWYSESQLFFSISCFKYTFFYVFWSELTCRWTRSWGKGYFVIVSPSLKEFQLGMKKTFHTIQFFLVCFFGPGIT